MDALAVFNRFPELNSSELVNHNSFVVNGKKDIVYNEIYLGFKKMSSLGENIM